jgi:hypothetical protein
MRPCVEGGNAVGDIEAVRRDLRLDDDLAAPPLDEVAMLQVSDQLSDLASLHELPTAFHVPGSQEPGPKSLLIPAVRGEGMASSGWVISFASLRSPFHTSIELPRVLPDGDPDPAQEVVDHE